MSAQTMTATGRVIRNLAETYHITYRRTATDQLASHISRLAGDDIVFDEIEEMLVGLARAQKITRRQMTLLQARYLRESKARHASEHPHAHQP
jgi:hypothetical protein